MGYKRKITCKTKSWNPVRRRCFSLGSLCLNFFLLAFLFFFINCRLVFIACHFVMACIKLSSVEENCYKIRFKQTPLKGKSLRTRRHSRKVWVVVCRRGLQTLTLLKTKIVHFATLFKTRQAISRP